ncbi:unnamed protein product [Discula destructiva]
MKRSAIVSLACSLSALANPLIQDRQVSYEGYGVFRVPAGDDPSRVNSLVEDLELEVWKSLKKPGAYADVVVPPEKMAAFQGQIAGIEGVEVMHENLAESIAAEQEPAQVRLMAADASVAAINTTWFSAYHSYADHLSYLGGLVAKYPGNAKLATSGTSLQGNTITGIQIYGSAGAGVKPAIVFHGTVHAREWISTMVNEYFMEALLGNYATDSTIKAYVDKYDFYIFPVVNPDGFLYSQSTDRMWRKNRQTTSGSTCLGHDINRNWPYQWDVLGGASTNPCAQDFKGRAAGDAPETKSLSAKLASIKSTQGLKLFADWHAYSQLFMTPYGYSCDVVAANNNEYQSLASGAADAIAALYGTQFTTGPICSTIYQATGNSVDYLADVTKADYSFTMELRDTGRYGFVLPPAQILPSGQEAFEGVKYLIQNIR